jgi:MFS family permease
VGGSLGDVYGERRVFTVGVGGFGLTSLACAIAPTAGALIAARALQGVAGALLTPAALAVIIATFTPSERGSAIGTWTAWSGIATIAGPLAGGTLVTLVGWRWIFLVNLPLVAVTLVLIQRYVVAGGGNRERRLDLPGAALAALGLAGPVFALIEQPQRGFADPLVWIPLVAGVALLALFVRHEARVAHPMLPLGLFRARNFAVGNVATLAIYGGLGAAIFYVSIFLQQVAGYRPIAAGVSLLPITA